MNDISKIMAELEDHISFCNDILSMLSNKEITRIQEIEIEKISRLVKYRNSHALLEDNSGGRFVELIDSLPAVAIQGYNRNREVVYWNKSSESIYGYSSSEALGKKLEDLILPDEIIESAIQGINDWYNNGDKDAIPAGELFLLRKDKTLAHVFSSHVMLGAGSENQEMFCVDVDLGDIASLKNENKSLEEKVNVDSLTNIHNRHYFLSIIDDRTKKCRLKKCSLSLIMFDVDFFKEINDQHGHDVGDSSLIELTLIVKSMIRDNDIFVRWGGEEFILLVDTNLNEAANIANKIRKNIEEKTSALGSIPSFTCSFGLVDMLAYSSFDQAYKNVDAKMYLAKNCGRNRVEY